MGDIYKARHKLPSEVQYFVEPQLQMWMSPALHLYQVLLNKIWCWTVLTCAAQVWKVKCFCYWTWNFCWKEIWKCRRSSHKEKAVCEEILNRIMFRSAIKRLLGKRLISFDSIISVNKRKITAYQITGCLNHTVSGWSCCKPLKVRKTSRRPLLETER